VVSWNASVESISRNRNINHVRYVWFKMYWIFKIPLSKEILLIIFRQKLLMIQNLPADWWRHLSLSASGAISSVFLTWQCFLKLTFPTPPRGPGNSVRLAAPEVGLIKSLLVTSYSKNKREWNTLGTSPKILSRNFWK
jgi:hypothetical protein